MLLLRCKDELFNLKAKPFEIIFFQEYNTRINKF